MKSNDDKVILEDKNDIDKTKYSKLLKGKDSVSTACSTEFLLIVGEYDKSSSSGLGGYGLDLI